MWAAHRALVDTALARRCTINCVVCSWCTAAYRAVEGETCVEMLLHITNAGLWPLARVASHREEHTLMAIRRGTESVHHHAFYGHGLVQPTPQVHIHADAVLQMFMCTWSTCQTRLLIHHGHVCGTDDLCGQGCSTCFAAELPRRSSEQMLCSDVTLVYFPLQAHCSERWSCR